MRWQWIGWCGISFYRLWTMSLSLCWGESRVSEHPSLFLPSLFFVFLSFSPITTFSAFPFLWFFLYMCAHKFTCVLMNVYVKGCVHVEAYHNKHSKSPVGIHTFSLCAVSLRHFWDSAHSTAHIQITQPAKASWMTSAFLSNTHTHTHTHTVYTIMYVCMYAHT